MSSTPTRPLTTPLVFTRVETVVVSARVTGQRVELAHRDFAGGVVPPEVVRDLLAKNAHTPVVVLVLRACKLVALPRELGQLTFLHELDVSDNALTDLPIELVALTNLAKLTLSGNKFKELPVFIGHLPGLLHLQVLGMPTLTTPHNLLRHGTEAICAYLRSSFVTLEEKQGELELNVRETFNVAKHADICFIVDGEPIHAHRLIIGLRIESPIIESFLASPNKEHKIEGVGAETFVRLLRFAYGNGLYESLKSPLANQAFFEMLDTLQVTTFGRNHRLVGTRMIIKRTDAMLRDDFIRFFHTANRMSYTPTTTTTTAAASTGDADEPLPPPSPSAPPTPQPVESQRPASDLKPQPPPPETESARPQGTTKRRGKQKRETRAEREMRLFAEAQARRAAEERQRELEAQAERDKAERDARIRSEQAEAEELAKKAQVERERQAAAATAETAAAAARAASGLLPPGMLLNEAFLRRHGWFADLRVRCASGGGGGEESKENEDEQEAEVKESETGHGAFGCHKFLLCVRSPYFQAKFEGGMSDALDKEIAIDEFERGPISQMLRFLYTDELTVNSDNAQDLLELSGHYQLERLRSVVEKFFGDNIDHDNVLSLLHLADHYQAYHLKVFCTSYVLKHQDAITSSAEWREYRKEHPELYSQLIRLMQ